ncbi:hypothetical protein EV356DRAFT_552302 [Viridothelium virens]|uniref:Uncharacterized protein n=1 Tax=Viridothelium virens TaxID=1048519 RepID=A0A6A6HK91_VIRVR|nr:hypothetical protein EV356DRAFT_552302 [Viridothelium virens]
MSQSSQAAGNTSEVASDGDWQRLIQEGAVLVSKLEKGPKGKSEWTYKNMLKQGWKQEDWNNAFKPFLEGSIPRVRLASVLELLKVSHKDKAVGGRNDYQVLKLDRERLDPKERELLQTDPNHGNFENAFNPKDGVLLCHRNDKPKRTAYDGAGREVHLHIPQPLYWSDLIFPQWEHFAEQAGCDARNLRYVFRSRITNDLTKKIIRRAIRAKINTSSSTQASGDLSTRTWPGHTFRTDSDEGRALLATPNARGIALGMIDRPEKYHGRVIEEIQVFLDDPPRPYTSSTVPDTCMLIRIVDQKPKQQTPQASQQKVAVASKGPSKARRVLKSAKDTTKDTFKEGCKGQSN